MQFKLFSSRALVMVILGAFVFTAAVLMYVSSNQKEVGEEVLPAIVTATDESIPVPGEKIRPSLPARIKIPKINLDTEIEYMGTNADGEMSTPKNISNVGWYELGVRPGETGSAVIAGHYGWENGKASAFDELHELRVGDRLFIEDGSGVVTAFVVRASRRYDPEEDASEVFTSTDGKSHLNLITCEGNWDAFTKSYSKRLVVFTDRE